MKKLAKRVVTTVPIWMIIITGIMVYAISVSAIDGISSITAGQ